MNLIILTNSINKHHQQYMLHIYIHMYIYIHIYICVYYMCMLSADNNSGDGTPSSRGRLQTPDM